MAFVRTSAQRQINHTGILMKKYAKNVRNGKNKSMENASIDALTIHLSGTKILNNVSVNTGKDKSMEYASIDALTIHLTGTKILNNVNVHFGKDKSMEHASIDAQMKNHSTGIMVNALISMTCLMKVPSSLPLKELQDNSLVV